MSSIMSIGISGMRAAQTRFQTAANSIVRTGALPSEGEVGAPKEDMATSLVAMQMASYDFKAATKIVEVGRDMMKSAIDILA
jgi:flagellar hook protein FlgE